MIRIPVQTEKTYEVLVERGLFARAGALMAPALPRAGKAFLVSDQTVYSLYGPALESSLGEAGFETDRCRFIPPAGEASKNLAVYGQAVQAMALAGLTREDVVIALGGGVMGDLGGFAAATYLRGLPWVQIPTSLLAMIDASVGGKTALNLPEGKNLLGAFHQPSLVLCDPALLETLPAEEMKNGMGELIKTAFLDRELWDALESRKGALPEEELIARAIRVKAALVAADEKDRGSRRLLNLGHSFGHAIEAASDYTIPHGQAVAMGLQIITRAAVKKGLCPPSVLSRLEALLMRYGLDRENPFDRETLLPYIRRDKKAAGPELTLIVPRDMGRLEAVSVPREALPDWIDL